MSIYKINQNLSLTSKIEALNNMILELNGSISDGKFNKNELDSIYTINSDWSRKFARNILLGNLYTDYTEWTHVHAQSGYSIWKIAPDNYAYNSLNELYFDNKLLANKGQASSEAISAFDKVFVYNGSTYADNSTEAASEGGTAFSLIADTDEYLYIGHSTTFAGITMEFATRGSNNTLDIEYWNGTAWTNLEFSGNELTDGTSDFASDGNITFDIPADWATTSVNSSTKYWIRITTTTTPVTTATAYLIVPANSVVGLLTLSSDDFFKENWAWCTYNGYIYVTIRNTGVAAYEGNAFITSSSTNANKQNFFISNHTYKINYQLSTYDPTSDITLASGVDDGDVVYVSNDNTFNLANASDSTKPAIAIVVSVTDELLKNYGIVRNVNTVGNGDIVTGDLVYLSLTDGKVTKTAPESGGRILQYIGRAITDEISGNKVDLFVSINYDYMLL